MKRFIFFNSAINCVKNQTADKQASGPFRSMRDTAKEIARMLRWHWDNKGEDDLSRWNCTAKQKQKKNTTRT